MRRRITPWPPSAHAGGDPQIALRLAIATYVALVALVGGRIIPSFTRNWLARNGAQRLPASFDKVDIAAIAALLAGLLAWAIAPDLPLIAIPATLAALLNAYRLWRWRGWATLAEPLVAVLHVGYSFVPLSMLTVAASAQRWGSQASSMHVLTVGVIGVMTLAVMTRATLGHSERTLTASRPTLLSYVLVMIAAVTRPFADELPDHTHVLLAVAGLAWVAAFGIFVLEFGPILANRRQP